MFDSPATFGPILERFENMGLSNNAFIISSIIGQEMNSAGSTQTALPILKAAEAIGTDNAKLMLSLQAALGTAYWRNGEQVMCLFLAERVQPLCAGLHA